MNCRWVTFALISVFLFTAQAQPRRRAKGHAERIVQPPPLTLDPKEIVNPNQPEIGVNAKGSGVLRAQILLDRAHYSCGELDADFGINMQKAVSAYQGDHGMPVTGMVDAATWAALNADTAPVLVAYTLTPDDVKGPFTPPIPKNLDDQAELPALGYTSAIEMLGERYHTSPEILKKLNPGTNFNQAGQPMMGPNVQTMPPAPEVAAVVVSKSDRSVSAYGPDNRRVAYYSATIGSEHDPLPIGNWKITGVDHHPVFHYDPALFWDAKSTDTKATLRPGPNNPVGVVWMNLSKEHYGIHGTPVPSTIGHTTSHGCIRLTNWDAEELASMVKPGIPAILKE
ncbi:MAG TPA: L,D-transpeptidase [Bryobacteraceae bacterium]